MKKSTIIVIVVIVLIAIWGITSYNGMVKMDESVSTAWSNVENQYQRRSDLIPNLVNTVKGYASHEKETFQAVVDARSKATQMQISADDLTPEMCIRDRHRTSIRVFHFTKPTVTDIESCPKSMS